MSLINVLSGFGKKRRIDQGSRSDDGGPISATMRAPDCSDVVNRADDIVTGNKGDSVAAEDDTQSSSELQQSASDHGTLICGFGEFGTDSSDEEVEEEWGADYGLTFPPLPLSQVQGETAVDSIGSPDNLNRQPLTDSALPEQERPIESKSPDQKDFSAVQKIAPPPTFSTLSSGMEEENGSRDQHYKKDFQMSFNKNIALCDLEVIEEDENSEEDSRSSGTDGSIRLCDLEVINEDEETEPECLPTSPPTVSNSTRVSDIHKDHSQANERSSQSVPKVLGHVPTRPIIPALSASEKATRALNRSIASITNRSTVKNTIGRQAILVKTSEEEYSKKLIFKPNHVRSVIYKVIKDHILFKACSEELLQDVIDVFQPADIMAGAVVMKQGDQGDVFYVMERGTVDVYVDSEHITALGSGTSFGEIALLYGVVRTASLRARCDCWLWSLDRSAYRGLIGQYKRKQLKKKKDILCKVKIQNVSLGDLKKSEIDAMALATQSKSFCIGDVIVRQGEPGDTFYMIEEGTVDVFIEEVGTTPVTTLKEGSFFGEKALLLKNDVRTATCIATSVVKCLVLMREDFALLLGDLQDLLDGSYLVENRDSMVAENESADKDDIDENILEIDLTDWDITRDLGQGAFGSVKLVRAKKPHMMGDNGGLFALKILSKEVIEKQGLGDHIKNELSIMKKLDHPFIVRFHSLMEDKNRLYFQLEALCGGTLSKTLQEMTKFPVELTRFYSACVLYAFCFMHSKKIAFRDLKPENLVMGTDGYTKIIDFGLAKIVTGKTWTLCGTPDYLAPEIILNEGHDWGVDYWTLGVLLFEMAEGLAPFASDNPMGVYKKVLSGNVTIPSHFSDDLSDLIVKLLNTTQSKRFGRTIGGGGAVMQHKWYSSLDWDALLEKSQKAPFIPRDYKDEEESSHTAEIGTKTKLPTETNTEGSPLHIHPDQGNRQPMNPSSQGEHHPHGNKVTYSLGKGNRHQLKLLQILSTQRAKEKSKGPDDNFRGTILRTNPNGPRKELATQHSFRSIVLQLAEDRKKEEPPSANAVPTDSDGELLKQSLHLEPSRSSFHQFSLLSVQPDNLIEDLTSSEHNHHQYMITNDRAHTFLDPFHVKSTDLIDQYASNSSGSAVEALEPEALAAFCFSNGLKVRLVPRIALDRAEKMGWFGKEGDKYQLHALTNALGTLSHGVSITVHELLHFHHQDTTRLIEILALHRKKRRAATLFSRHCRQYWVRKRIAASLIARSWRRHRTHRSSNPRRQKNRNGSIFNNNRNNGRGSMQGQSNRNPSLPNENFSAQLRRGSDLFQTVSKWVGGDSKRRSHHSRRGSSGSNHRGLSRDSRHLESIDRELDQSFKSGSISTFGYSDDDFVPWSLDEESVSTLDSEVSDTIKEQAKEAYDAMVKADEFGDVCIVEKCYVLIGTKSQDQSLLFCALQQLVDAEREERSLHLLSPDREHPSESAHSAKTRKSILMTMQRKLQVPPKGQAHRAFQRRLLSNLSSRQEFFEIDMDIDSFKPISLPLPLPHISGEWGFATLVLRISISHLLMLMKLLLLERSVFIIGDSVEEVTSCACALLELLKPYEWASCFMPMLHRDMLDFVCSPVPFIAGLVVDRDQLDAIENDYRVKASMCDGLSVLNLTFGRLNITEEAGMKEILVRSPNPASQLFFYEARLKQLFQNNSSTLHSLKMFVQSGLSQRESLTLNSMRSIIRKHLQALAGPLWEKPESWEEFGEFNEITETFEFSPYKFVQPLKDKMMFQIKFQEMMAHTQLFVGFVEDRQNYSKERMELLKGKEALFIAHWIYHQWEIKGKKVGGGKLFL